MSAEQFVPGVPLDRTDLGQSLPHLDHDAVLSWRPIPAHTDLRNAAMPPVWDQGRVGTCASHAILAAYLYRAARQGRTTPMLSRMFHNYNGRLLAGTQGYDSGITIANAARALQSFGAPPEIEWDYLPAMLTVKPNEQAYTDGLKHQAILTKRIALTETGTRSALAGDFPFVIGLLLYRSFYNDKSGRISLPTQHDQLLGGHAVLITGHDDETERFTFRNSWSTAWADQGYGTLPYSYVFNADLTLGAMAVTLTEG